MTESANNVLIIGGGIAGMSAARVLDGCGVPVHLVEKKEHIGGNAFDWACMATDICQYCGACLSAELADQVGRLKHTRIYCESRLSRLEPDKNGFRVSIDGKENTKINVRAILLATGLSLFDPAELKFFEYKHDRVITTAELNGILKQERLLNILKGNSSPAIAFIQCVGSRNREIDRDYCSQVCCKTSFRQANKIIHQLPKAEVAIFHIDLQTIGKLFRKQVKQAGNRIKLFQGVPAKILSNPKKDRLTIIKEDEQTGSRAAYDFDLIVLAVGSKPAQDIQGLAEILGGRPDRWGYFSNKESKLPKGIYVAGAAKGPTDILTARQQGLIAARQILQDINAQPCSPVKTGLAIFGGDEGKKIAQAMSKKGYKVFLFDTGTQDISDNAGINYFPQSRLIELSGTFGRFCISLEAKGGKHTIEVFAIILASGVDSVPFSKAEDPSFNGTVIPLSQFSNRFHHTPDELPENILFWLDRTGPEWKVHARESLLMAIGLREMEKRATIIMEKMLVHGLEGQRIYDRARKLGVKFLRVSSPTHVKLKKSGGSLTLEITEATLPGVRVVASCDLLVVPEKIQVSRNSAILAGHLHQAVDEDGFMQSANVRHRPVGSPRRGIFFAGTCHEETDDQDLDRDIRAIQASLEILATRGPEMDKTPEINEGKCAKCLTCYRICPHAAIVLKNEFQPFIIPEACFDCGLCISSCPAEAIFNQAPMDTGMLENKAPKVVVFLCERSADLALKSVQKKKGNISEHIAITPVRCASQLDAGTLIEPFLKGADRVLVASCHKGNCRSMTGDRFIASRIEHIRSETGITPSMLSYHSIAANEPIKAGRIVYGAVA